jgi:hypothetical protein
MGWVDGKIRNAMVCFAFFQVNEKEGQAGITVEEDGFGTA